MASPPVIDIEALAAPLPGERATGSNLREDPSSSLLYYQVKDARKAARDAERIAAVEDEGMSEPPNWRLVLDLSQQVLSNSSKNLEITAWMIEALARLKGFAGIRDGFLLARRLVENFWDDLYPEPDEDGVATKVAPLTGLNGEGDKGTLVAPINCIPITEGSSAGPFAAFQHEQARELGRITDDKKLKQKVAAGYISPQDFEAAVRETSPDAFQTLTEDLQQAIDEYAALCKVLDERCGADSPPSSYIREALTGVQATLQFITRDILQPAQAPEQESSEQASEQATAGGSATAGAAPRANPDQINTREDAFRLIKKVADYFREVEPHSPLPYALDQAIRWGRMGLPEFLKEVITDDSARKSYFRLTGIPEGEH